MQRHLRRFAESKTVAVIMLVLLIAFSIAFVIETSFSEAPLFQAIAYLAAGGALCYGALAQVLSHYGYVSRLEALGRHPTPAERAIARRIRIGALIPTYREAPELVYRAMLSVALQRTEHKWLRLLIDDPPDPQTDENARLLDAARALPRRVDEFLAPLERIVRQAGNSAMRDRSQAPLALARAHRRLAFRFARLARDWPDASADDRFFRCRVLADLAVLHAGEAMNVPADAETALAELVGLSARFRSDVGAFERKTFANMSHAANKAMNLNTGLHLIGKHVAAVDVLGERRLFEDAWGDILFPPCDFVMTLDADSLVAPSYAETLLAIATAEDAGDVAVVQTPYATLPEPETKLERAAGATTDVQRIMHLGLHHFGAAFWIGANAVLRVAALREIAVDDEEHGRPIRRYIRDRTPIEDAESTIDLAMKGWRVHNHDAEIAWSATPADFGALVIQRRRWACGGLIVLPKAIRAAAATPGSRRAGALQLLLRSHYLGSLTWVPLALLIVLLAPFDASLAGVFLPLVAVPYFVTYWLDLILTRRSVGELVQVYGLNLLLIPVNLAGAWASIRQAITGRKVPFARTPKVPNRTAAPVRILLAIWGGACMLLLSAACDAWLGNENRALFAAVNGAALLAATLAFVGARASREDIQAGFESYRGRFLPAPLQARLDRNAEDDPLATERHKAGLRTSRAGAACPQAT